MGNANEIPLAGVSFAPNTRSFSVQSSLASDMQARAQAILTAEIAAGRNLVDAALSGAGDGHSFMLTLFTSSTRTVYPNVDGVLCYVAPNGEALDAVAQAALNSLTDGGGNSRSVVGLAEAGSCDGHRWMGVIFHSAVYTPP